MIYVLNWDVPAEPWSKVWISLRTAGLGFSLGWQILKVETCRVVYISQGLCITFRSKISMYKLGCNFLYKFISAMGGKDLKMDLHFILPLCNQWCQMKLDDVDIYRQHVECPWIEHSIPDVKLETLL